jgi:hypothetical protein
LAQNRTRSQQTALRCGQFGEPNQLLVEGDGTSDIWWQRFMWFSVDPDDGEYTTRL